ncbi:hypothetical protein [Caulobacter sp. CCG-8]|uniref:hypothetical protein n=1 Tax=Caulobacter sp. CCG-8 TaxID=3127958 RepID=UPI00307D9EEC
MSPKIPDAPKVFAPPPPPTVNQATIEAEKNDASLRRQGRAATFKSDPLSRSTGGFAVKQLMGQGGWRPMR